MAVAMALADAVVAVRADTTRLSSDFRSVQQRATRQMGSIVGGISRIASGIAASMGIVGITAAFGTALRGAVQFEKGINEVFTLVPGMSADAKKKMGADVAALSKEMRVLPSEIVPALYQAISAGVPPDNVFEFLRTSVKASVGGVTTLQTSVDGLSSVVNAYGSDVLSAAQASDVMFTTVKLGKTNFEELSRFLFQVIPTASALGVKFGDVGAAMATITAQGTPTRVAATQVRQALIELSKEGSKAAATFKKVSGKSFKEFIASGGNLQQALQVMEGHAKSLGLGINDLFGSVESGNAALQLTGKGTEKFAASLAEMGKATGATDTAFSEMNDTASRSIQGMLATFQRLAISLGKIVLPMVASLADAISGIASVITGAIDAFVAFDDSIGGFAITALKATAAIAGLVTIGPKVVSVVRLIGAAIKTQLITTGIGALIVATGLAVAAIIKLIQWVGKMKPVQDAMAKAAEKIRPAWEKLKAAFSRISQAILRALKPLLRWFGVDLGETVGDVVAQIIDAFADLTVRVVDYIAAMVTGIADWLDAFINKWRTTWDVAVTTVKLFGSRISDIFSAIMRGAFTEILKPSPDTIRLAARLAKDWADLFGEKMKAGVVGPTGTEAAGGAGVKAEGARKEAEKSLASAIKDALKPGFVGLQEANREAQMAAFRTTGKKDDRKIGLLGDIRDGVRDVETAVKEPKPARAG